MKKLYLVDVSSMFFRAFYAIRSLNNSKGLPTNAIYGFLAMSVKLLKDVHPDYMVYCFDQPTPSFRKELFEGYKANRSETPEELVPQIPYVRKLTELMGIPSMSKENYEADDVIGSLAQFGVDNNLEVVIVSGDKDFAQLINDKISMYDTMKDVRYDIPAVVDKWGVRPDQIIDYLAICGDSSDNIPGVRGVGPKGAQKLLHDFETLDGVYQNIESIKAAGLKTKLIENKDNAYLSKKLVEIVTDLKLVSDLNQIRLKPIDSDKLAEVLDELEFSSFKKNLLGAATDSQKNSNGAQEARRKSLKVQLASLQELDQWLRDRDSVIAWKDARHFFLSRENDCRTFDGDLSQCGQLLHKKNLRWRGFDVKTLWREIGVHCGEVVSDVMLSAYLLKAGPIKNINEVYHDYCGKTLPEFPQPSDIVGAIEECEQVLHEKLQETKMLPILQTVDLPLVEVLASMEAKGVLLDTKLLSRESSELAKEIASLEQDIKALAGEEFNVASPKQLSVILFEKLGLSKGKKTKTGYSTATDVLEKLTKEHPIAEKIVEYRELSKLKSTYVDALPELINLLTNRVHTVFNQALTTTGRLSSNHPNLQNIPIRTERGKRVREAFVVPKGYKMLSADYSQIELRVLAHITKDPGLVKAFKDDRDIHAWTAAEIFGTSVDQVDSAKRRMAKAVNFGIAYGQGVFGLAETLQISRSESKEIIDNYFKKFPGVKAYMDDVVERAKQDGFVETLFGRRRYLPELTSRNPMQRAFGERAAINAPIQGTASDLVKMAMLELYEDYAEYLLLQVHDELLFELKEAEVEESATAIRTIMENNVKLDVPLKVNVSWGDNWSEAH